MIEFLTIFEKSVLDKYGKEASITSLNGVLLSNLLSFASAIMAVFYSPIGVPAII